MRKTQIGVGVLLIAILLVLGACAPVKTPTYEEATPIPDEKEASESKPIGKIMFSTIDGGIHVINPDGSNEIGLAVKGGGYFWLPDGSKISFVGDHGELYTINPDGTDKTTVCTSYPSTSWPCWYRWLPDGKKLVLATYAESNAYINGIYTMEHDGSNLVMIAEGEFSDVVVSSNGERIIYMSEMNQGIQSLYTMNIDGTDKNKVTETDIGHRYGAGLYLSLSPDGERITSYAGSDEILYSMDVDGNNRIALARRAKSPAWSPDGYKIAYMADNALFVIKHDSTSRIKLAEVAAGEHLTDTPVWSPDGKNIAFVMHDNIYIINADGSGLTKLIEDAGMYPAVQWSPF